MAKVGRRPEVKFSLTGRFIRDEDASRPFQTAAGLGALAEYVDLSNEPGSFAVVKESDGKILGVVLTVLDGDALLIDRIVRNGDGGYKGVGGELLLVVEKELAPALGVRELRLEAMNEDLVRFYRRFGFIERGPRVRDAEWGRLTPMSKQVD